jgi:AraC-like DNA-binding protein
MPETALRTIELPSFPLPVFTAALLFWLCVTGLWRRNLAPVTLFLLALCGGQAMLTALGLYYGIGAARLVLPISAAAIPGVVWISFVNTAQRRLLPHDSLHLLGPAFALFCRLTVPATLDVFLPLLFLGYGIVLLLALRTGGDGLPRLSLAHGDIPSRLWKTLAWALIASACSDGLIVLVQGAGREDLAGWIISFGSSLTLVLLGTLALTPELQPDETETATMPAEPADLAADVEVMARLHDMMLRETLYLDPDLTLNRMSRRLRVPAKRLSEAINRQTGGNVSRYINRFRVKTACDLLARGQSVTEAMLASGFNTKSNFNREFLRVTGKSPSVWRGQGYLQLPAVRPTSVE